MKYWEIIADNLSKAVWSWGCISAVDSQGAHNLDCRRTSRRWRRFVVRADDKPTAFLELARIIFIHLLINNGDTYDNDSRAAPDRHDFKDL
jgi:hypothetical protein